MKRQILQSIESFARQRWVNYVLVLTGFALVLVVVGNVIYRNWSEFQTFSWQLNPLPLAGAGIALDAPTVRRARQVNVLTDLPGKGEAESFPAPAARRH